MGIFSYFVYFDFKCYKKVFPWQTPKHTNNSLFNEYMKQSIAVEVEFKDSRYCDTGSDEELIVFARVCDIYTVPQQVDGMHDNIIWVPWKSQVKVAG